MFKFAIIKITSIVFALSLVLMPIKLLGQDYNIENQISGDFGQGYIQGQFAAKGSASWILGGFCCGIFGVGAAYFIVPDPPAYALMGKSTEYMIGFSEGYRKQSRKKNLQNASIGCVSSILFTVLMNANNSN